ncbi:MULTISPECIES: hypothetical protein [unclassified Cupriavidus]|uniref:hypothetical protein n=1 Tax=unclassified Cupriavidus TaxID=2640874 RepID=UPI00088BB9ED|nr:hypothetical protein [Cupriavidus sp. YR651]SDC90301.1 hypothetical protein SAMN05216345_104383 [Cupriavidus sp. YR651]
MKSALLALCGAASLLASLSAIAGPDFAVIERARAEAQHRHARAQQPACDVTATSAPQAAPVKAS